MRAIVSGAVAGVVVVVIAVAVALAVVPGIAPLAASPLPVPTIALLYPSAAPVPSASPSPTAAPSPSPTPTPLPTASPAPCPTAKPGASASPPACPTPVPTPTPAPTPSPTPIPGVGLAIGSPAPPLSLDVNGGGTFDLASLRGQPAWIVFATSWCPACRTELPLVQKYAAAIADRMTVVVVDVREDPATVASFAKAMKLTVPVALDPHGQAQRAWGAFALSIHYWIGADGTVRGVAYGGVSAATMLSNIHALVPDASFAP